GETARSGCSCHPAENTIGPPPPLITPRGSPMAIRSALHSVSYAGVWPGQARLTLEQFLDKAKALGFDAVMLMAKRPHLSVLDCDADARRAVRSQAERLGLRVACLAGYTDFGMAADRPDIPAREMQ